MKFFTAYLATETNTFAPAPTGWGGFDEYGLFRGDASWRAPQGLGLATRLLRQRCEAEGHQLIESVTAFAQPLGRTVRAVYETLRDEILEDLRAAAPIDAVILLLHGAMVADGYDDCEGDLLARVRKIVGPRVPIGVELDLHCHMTRRMCDAADVIIAFKEYPHVDAMTRLYELYRIVADAALGRVRPVTAMFDCKMVGLWHTTREPMQGFVRQMQACEKLPGVLSVSLGHGFAWGDVPEAGAKLWVVTDGDLPLAQTLAAQLGRQFWDLRERIGSDQLAVDQALDTALRLCGQPGHGPVVLADTADNPGGGAMGDSTFILQRIVERGIGNVALGLLWDLGAIQICRDAGVGARIDLRLGGKFGPASGQPLDLSVTVRALSEDFFQMGLNSCDERAPLGTGVWLQWGQGVDLVLASVRSQVFSTSVFTSLGIALADKQIVVVKSTQHFHAQFAPMARAVLYVDTPGAIAMSFASIPYRRRSLDYWPRVPDPHGFGEADQLGSACLVEPS